MDNEICQHGYSPPYSCPRCSGNEEYAPTIYRKSLQQIYDGLHYYRHGGAMDGGQDERTMCVMLANTMLNLLGTLIEEKRMRDAGVQDSGTTCAANVPNDEEKP